MGNRRNSSKPKKRNRRAIQQQQRRTKERTERSVVSTVERESSSSDEWDAYTVHHSDSGSSIGVGLLDDEVHEAENEEEAMDADGEAVDDQTEYDNEDQDDVVDDEADQGDDDDQGDDQGDDDDQDDDDDQGDDQADNDDQANVVDDEAEIEATQLNVVRDTRPPLNHVVDIKAYEIQMTEVRLHAQNCELGGWFQMKGKINAGLTTTWSYLCTACDEERKVYSHGTTKEVHERRGKGLNDCMVWGCMATGIGYAQAEEFLSLLNMPMMGRSKYKKHENSVGESWKEYVEILISRNGEQEYALAKEAGQIVLDRHGNETDLMYTTVIGDAGWGKRSYKGHGMTSPAGIGVVIGALSHKILFVGVRNTYCSRCSLAKRAGKTPSDHACFMNYKGPATSMEQDIIVEAFCESKERHRLVYRRYIGDGDSNTFKQIRARVPYGPETEKIECANHVVVRFSDRLHGLKENKEIPTAARRLLTAVDPGSKMQRLDRLIKGVRVAIKAAARSGDVRSLRCELANAPLHVFGRHDQCGSFCNRKEAGEDDVVQDIEDSGLLTEIRIFINKMIGMADSLVYDNTTNQAERFMSLVAKANGGKRVANWKGGSYSYRGQGATIAHSEGPGWFVSPLKRHLQESPGERVRHLSAKRTRHCARKLALARAHKEAGTGPRKLRRGGRPDQFYGPNAAESLSVQELLEEHPDPPEERVQELCKDELERMALRVNTAEKVEALRRDTLGQSLCVAWKSVRRGLLTASKFGDVMVRLARTRCHALVYDIVYGTSDISKRKQVQYGLTNESVAVELYDALYNKGAMAITETGLHINPQWPYLGASPDRLFGDDGLIEVKCIHPFTLKGLSYKEAALAKGRAKPASFCLKWVDGRLQLSRSHKYYYQVQGQLSITGRKSCVLIVYCEGQLHYETINRDDELWNQTMLPKLTRFFMDCVLVERCLRRVSNGLPCRDPPYIEAAVRAYEEARCKK